MWVMTRIGGTQSGANYFAGIIDDVQLYDCILSEAQIGTIADRNAVLAPSLDTWPSTLWDSPSTRNLAKATPFWARRRSGCLWSNGKR